MEKKPIRKILYIAFTVTNSGSMVTSGTPLFVYCEKRTFPTMAELQGAALFIVQNMPGMATWKARPTILSFTELSEEMLECLYPGVYTDESNEIKLHI